MAQKVIKYYVVDAFTDTMFKGNPAAVCLLVDTMKDDKWLQSVATEFNLPMTAYLTPLVVHSAMKPRFQLRWLSPVSEFELCGHATLAASHVIFQSGMVNSNTIEFSTISGILTAKRISSDGFHIELDFPAVPVSDINDLEASAILEILDGVSVVDVLKRNALDDIIVVLPSEKEVLDFKPQFDKIKEAQCRAIIFTARASNGSGFDFYSRVFSPQYGVNEDAVCGSAHCALVTHWHEKLEKCDFVAYQFCGDRSNCLQQLVSEPRPSSRPETKCSEEAIEATKISM